jgi:hypothetical protein
MGYINSGSTTTLTAKLTPYGRTMLLQNDTTLISTFSLGDSDANYNAALPLSAGQVSTNGGNIGANNSISNSVGNNVNIKSVLFVNSTNAKTKAVEPQSSGVTFVYVSNGQTTISGANITQNIVNRNNINTDPLVNLYYTFNLPLSTSDDYKFTGLTSNFGGYANTALSGIDATNILVIGLNNNNYGELIDGKSIKLNLSTTASSYTIYSTYQNTGIPLSVQDANNNDTATNTQFLGSNIAFLFSDNIAKPSGNPSLSWATGYNTVKPFSKNNKQLYNLTTNSNLSQTADTIVGIAYLDKGFCVITHPTIVNSFNTSSTATSVTLTSLSSTVSQNITCIADRGEFAISTNTTFSTGDTPRISEVGLYDINGSLIAIAKTDRHILKNINDFFALSIKITV